LFPVLVFIGAISSTSAARFPRSEVVHCWKRALELGISDEAPSWSNRTRHYRRQHPTVPPAGRARHHAHRGAPGERAELYAATHVRLAETGLVPAYETSIESPEEAPSFYALCYLPQGETRWTGSLSPSQVGALFRICEHTAFRLETREVHKSANEAEALHQFVSGESVDIGWFRNHLTLIEDAAGEGRRFSRSRVMATPLSDYSRFRLFCSERQCRGRWHPLPRERERRRPVGLRLLAVRLALLLQLAAVEENFLDGDVVEGPAVIVNHNYWRDAAWHQAVRRDNFAAE
jgi:hypothetical protein